MQAMLAETVRSAVSADRLIRNDNWWASQKVDGHRLIVKVTPKQVRYINRNGDRYQHPVGTAVKQFFSNSTLWADKRWVFDGEYLPDTDTYWVFDIIESPFTNADTIYSERFQLLRRIFTRVGNDNVRVLPVHSNQDDKAQLLLDVHQNGGEGIMFRHVLSTYTHGRTDTLLKFKFTATADVEVVELRPEGRRSVSMQVYDNDGTPVPVGTVMVTDRMLDVLNPGDVIEVRYMYRGAQGKLYSPAFLRRRTDKPANQCSVDQLKPTDKGVLV